MATYSTISGNNTTFKAYVCWTFVPASPSLSKGGINIINSTALSASVTASAPSTGTFYINNVSGYRTDTYTSSAESSANYVNIAVGGSWINKSGSSIYFNNKSTGTGGKKWNYVTATNYKWTSVSASTRNFNMRSYSTTTSTLNKWFNTTVNCGVSLTTTYSKDNSTWQSSNTFTGLTENTTYHLYAKTVATSASGNTSTTYWNDSVRTYTSHPYGVTLEQTGVTENSFSVKVGASIATSAGAITNYTIYYGKKGSTDPLIPWSLGTSTTGTLTGLEEGTDYKFVMVARNIGGDYLRGYVADGYTYYDSLTTSGTQYFNTGYYPNANTKVVMLHKWTNVSTTQQRPFGVVSGNLSYNMYINGNGNMAWASQNSTGNWQQTGMKADTSHLYCLTLDNYTNVVKIGNSISMTMSTTHTNTASYPMFLCAGNTDGAVSNQASMYYYQCAIYEADKMVHCYLPAVRNSDSVSGLYDCVTETFLTNAGSGTATVSSVITWTSTFTTLTSQASIYLKNSNWSKGKVWIKINGVWKKAKAIYKNVSGTWKKGN